MDVNPRQPAELTVTELKQRLDRGEPVQLIDVREPAEFARARLPGAVLIPLGQVVARWRELDPGREAVVMCRAGMRSERAIALLRQAGYPGALANLRGGILAWARDVDPDLPPC
jgi:adenylyltransferase/sulfurtransferase